jgi:hypothetical protein
MGLRRRTKALIRSALLRAARTFSQAFVGTVVGAPVLGVHAATLRLAAVSGFVAVLTLVQRALDASPVPTIPAG